MRDLRLSEAATPSSSHGGGSGIKRQYRHILPQPMEIFRYETQSVHKFAQFHVFCSSWFYFWLIKPRLQTIYELGSTNRRRTIRGIKRQYRHILPQPMEIFRYETQSVHKFAQFHVFCSSWFYFWLIKPRLQTIYELGSTNRRRTIRAPPSIHMQIWNNQTMGYITQSICLPLSSSKLMAHTCVIF